MPALVALLMAAALAPARAQPLALDVASAKVAYDPRTNEALIVIAVTPAAGQALSRFTAENVGRKVDVRIDGRTMISPVVREPIVGSVLQISGVPPGDVNALTARLASGVARLEIEAAKD